MTTTNKTRIHRDLDKRTLTVERRFNAPRPRVWRAYTEPQLLDQWWAPQPWKAETQSMDFRVGGSWRYAMKGPEGEVHYARMDFSEIVPEERFVALDVFADEAGNTAENMPKQTFVTTFIDKGAATEVVVVAEYESVEDLEKVIEMGIETGLTMAQDQLEALLGQKNFG